MSALPPSVPRNMREALALIDALQDRIERLQHLYEREFIRRQAISLIERYDGNWHLLHQPVIDRVRTVGCDCYPILLTIAPRDLMAFADLDVRSSMRHLGRAKHNAFVSLASPIWSAMILNWLTTD